MNFYIHFGKRNINKINTFYFSNLIKSVDLFLRIEYNNDINPIKTVRIKNLEKGK